MRTSALDRSRRSELYKQRRKQMIEPVFGDTKFNRGIDRFHQTRQGRRAAPNGG